MDLNSTAILGWVSDSISNLSAKGIQELSKAGANPSPILSKLIPLFLGAVLIWLGSKVSGKVAKIVMILLGIVIVLIMGYSFLNG